MKYNRIIAAFAATALLGASCSDLSDLEKRMDSLESRVAALEQVVATLNANVEGVAAMMNAGSINSVKESGGVYSIVLSDGQEIKLTQGSIGVATAPVVSVDADGYWMIDYGKGSEYILINGAKVSSNGGDGITPVFAVSAAGNWTVSYDGGKTYTDVLDDSGKPVSAISGGASTEDIYFAGIEYDEASQTFEVTLKNGTKISLPVCSSFLCAIQSEGTQSFNYDEQRNFTVEMLGVEQTFVTAPAGWTAVLSESVLSVTAPSAPTKATLADTRTDISILAIGANNLAAIAKLKVQLSDSPIAVKPIIVLTAGESTVSSVTFTATLSNAESWKYLVQSDTEVAPSAEKVYETGISGTGTSATISDLEAATSYVVYAVPVSGTTLGAVASVILTTKEETISNFYEAWNEGKAITIGGKKYSKEDNGEATLLSEDSTISADGVYFIAPTASVKLNNTASFKKLIIVGNIPGQRSTLTLETQLKLMQADDETNYLLLRNIVFDAITSVTNYAVVQNSNVAFGRIAFDDCKIMPYNGKPLSYISPSTRSIADLTIVNSEYAVGANNMWLLSLSSSTAKYASITLENNIFYAKSGTLTGFRIFHGPSASIGDIVLTKNTFINLASDTACLVNAQNGGIDTAKVTNNLFYFSGSLANNTGILFTTNYPATGTCKNNLVSKKDDGFTFSAFYNGASVNGFEGAEEVAVTNENPFSTFNQTAGIFTQSDSYKNYGATR